MNAIGYSGRPAQGIDQQVGSVVHSAVDAIFASRSQAKSCDNRVCDNRSGVANGRMPAAKRLQPEAAEIFARLDALDLPQKELAAVLGIEADKVSKARAGERQFKAAEVLKATRWLSDCEGGAGKIAADIPPTRTAGAGETAEIIRLDLSLPMGQGATVDDYIEEEPVIFDLGYIRGFTRTAPSRLRLARGVGDSMMPTLLPGDAVWIDSTQRQLNQSDKVWAVSINGGAAIKRLRPLREGKVLVISDNKTIGDYEVDAEEIMIGGRVVRFERDI